MITKIEVLNHSALDAILVELTDFDHVFDVMPRTMVINVYNATRNDVEQFLVGRHINMKNVVLKEFAS